MSTTEPADPGVGFQAAAGIYVGALATAVVSLGLVVAGVSSSGLLSTIPTVFTAGLVAGALAAWARPGVAAELGAQRWRAVETTLPPVVLGCVALGLARFGSVSPDWHLIPVGIATVVSIIVGWELAAIAHDTYVETVTGEPAVSWRWKKAGVDVTGLGIAVSILAVGAALASVVDGRSVMLFVVAIPFLAQGLGPVLPTDPREMTVPTYYGMTFEVDVSDYARSELQAYDAGLVIDPAMKPSYRTLVPWERITDVRLTADELVVERQWRPAIRCDRSAIDDPEAVEDALRRYT